MSEPLILVVEDDENLAPLVGYNLERAGYRFEVCGSGEDALELLARRTFDLVLLDIMLPGVDGFEVCRQVRANQLLRGLPIIVLTAKGEEIDKVLGFELGIDDYVVKPFSPRELCLRVRAVLRRDRRSRAEKQDTLSAGTLNVDIARHQVSLDGRPLVLTLMEFKLLVTLLGRKGHAQSRERLLSDVWDVDRNINTRTIDTHITRLREKLGDTGKMIETVRGFGYRFASPAEER